MAKKIKPAMILWGKRPDTPWLKLTDNVSCAERERRRRDGWEVTVRKQGEHPDPRCRLCGGEENLAKEGESYTYICKPCIAIDEERLFAEFMANR